MILKIISPHTSRLSSYIQGKQVDVRKVRNNADLTVKTLEGCRSDENFELVWKRLSLRCDEVKKFINSEEKELKFKEAKLPRRRKPCLRRQALVGESTEGPTEFEDLQAYHRVDHYFAALDNVT